MQKRIVSLALGMIALVVMGCTKEADNSADCENDNTSEITYTNQGTVPLRVKVSETLTPGFEPISPILDFDLAPGASVVKVIKSNRYFTTWYNNCATSCNRVTYYNKTYATCGKYDEKL